MTHTILYKNELYLILLSVISLGVLSGSEYFNFALAVLLIIPILNIPSKKI